MVTKEDVGAIAETYLIMNVGNLVAPAKPKFDEEKKLWTVPVFHHSKFAHFEMGEMTIDTEGNVITLKLLEDSPEIRELDRLWREKYSYEAQGLTGK